MVTIPSLPEDVFLLILENLDSWDMVRCRKVSKAWQEVFTKTEYMRLMLKKYPLAREIQELANSGILSKPATQSTDWQDIFDKVASRYYHLTHGKARSLNKYKLAASEPIQSLVSGEPLGLS